MIKQLILQALGLCNPKTVLEKTSTTLISEGFAVFEKAQSKIDRGLEKAHEELAKVEDDKTDLMNEYFERRGVLTDKANAIEAGITKAEALKGNLAKLLGA